MIKKNDKRYEINVEKTTREWKRITIQRTNTFNNTTYMVSFSLRRADQRKTGNMISMNNLFLSLSLALPLTRSISFSLSLSLRINNSALENMRNN